MLIQGLYFFFFWSREKTVLVIKDVPGILSQFCKTFVFFHCCKCDPSFFLLRKRKRKRAGCLFVLVNWADAVPTCLLFGLGPFWRVSKKEERCYLSSFTLSNYSNFGIRNCFLKGITYLLGKLAVKVSLLLNGFVRIGLNSWFIV